MAYGRYKIGVPGPEHFGLLDSRSRRRCEREKVGFGRSDSTERSGRNSRDARIRLYSVDLCPGYTSYFAPRVLARKRQSAAHHVPLQPKRASIFGGTTRRRSTAHRAKQCGTASIHGEVGEMLTTAFQRLLAEIKAQPATHNATSISIPSRSAATIHRRPSVIILTGTSCGDKVQSEIKPTFQNDPHFTCAKRVLLFSAIALVVR